MRFIRFGRTRIFHIFIILVIGLFVTCPRHIYAQISIDRLLVSSDKPTDTVDGSNGKAWSVTERSYVPLGDTFYIGFDGLVIDSDCSVYVVITDPDGTEYKSSTCSFNYNPEGLSTAFGLANDNIETFFGKCKSEIISENSKKSIREREQELIAAGRADIISDGLRKIWQAEIDKYSKIVQEEIIL